MIISRRGLLLSGLALPAGFAFARGAAAGVETIVYDGAQLQAALRAAALGDVITLAPGDYAALRGSLTLAAPGVTLRALMPLAAVLRSALAVVGPGCLVDGLAFEGAGIRLAGEGARLAGSRVHGAGIEVAGTGNEIAYCEVADFPDRGINISGAARNPLVHHCHIHDPRPGKSASHTAIGIGRSQKDTAKQVGAVVEYNLLERISVDSEALTVKSSGNLIRFNTLRDSRGFISNRHGEGNVYAGNTLERTYGFVVQDRGTQLLGNLVTGTLDRRSVRINGGSIAWDSVHQGEHPQACDTLLSGNVMDLLVIGQMWKGFSLPALNTTVAAHTGPIKLGAQLGTIANGVPVEAPAPVALTAAEVGPAAVPVPMPAPSPDNPAPTPA